MNTLVAYLIPFGFFIMGLALMYQSLKEFGAQESLTVVLLTLLFFLVWLVLLAQAATVYVTGATN